MLLLEYRKPSIEKLRQSTLRALEVLSVKVTPRTDTNLTRDSRWLQFRKLASKYLWVFRGVWENFHYEKC